MKTNRINKQTNQNAEIHHFGNAYIDKQNIFEHPSATSRFGWKVSEDLLKSLHSHLYNYGLIIEADYERFREHFWGAPSENIDYITWYGETTQLVFVFECLIIYNCIPNHNGRKHKLISEHFCNKFGVIYKPKVLGVTLNQIRNNSIGISLISEIIDKLFESGLEPNNHQA